MVNDTDGSEYRMRAEYTDVEAPRFLAWREVDSGVLTSVTFVDLGDGATEVVTHQRGLPPEYRTPEARAGWQTALERGVIYVEDLARQPKEPS